MEGVLIEIEILGVARYVMRGAPTSCQFEGVRRLYPFFIAEGLVIEAYLEVLE